jgi:hypothetical protein
MSGILIKDLVNVQACVCTRAPAHTHTPIPLTADSVKKCNEIIQKYTVEAQ